MHEKFEEKLKERLLTDLGNNHGNTKYVEYVSAKNEVADILANIVRVEPGLTDHTIAHVNRVLGNAYQLLGDAIDEFCAMELYCLAICIVFHDVGNIKGRDGHKYKIAEQYDRVRKDHQKYRDEKVVVTEVGEAHCGRAKDGTYNTLALLRQLQNIFIDRQKIELCNIGAVLRLADELDEGLFRTSPYALDSNLISDDNVVYHKYAADTKIDIDRKGKRILVTYHINIPRDPDAAYKEAFVNYITFIYERIVKVNQERQYTKHYCRYIEPFKELSVSFKFWKEESWGGTDVVRHNLPPIVMTDLVVPKDSHYSVEERYPDYQIDNLMKELFGDAEPNE